MSFKTIGVLIFVTLLFCNEIISQQIPLQTHFNKEAQIEVGGIYVGIEMHHSLPSLQRISFYYPVANSIDLSTDYWTRDTSFISSMGLKIGNGKRERIGFKPMQYDITPYSVSFSSKDKYKSLSITYKFSKNKPAMFVIYELTNNSRQIKDFEFDTHLETSVKTSHTFRLIDSAWTEYDSRGSAIYTNFDNPQTQNVQIFVANAAETPVAFYTRSNGRVFNEVLTLGEQYASKQLINRNEQTRPAAIFLYKKNLKPSEKMTIVQIIGSCRQNEGRDNVSYFLSNYKKEIDDFENSVNDYTYKNTKFVTGDKILDKSYYWAKAILDVNRHYIDGQIRPMPCPAEYNFYFSHDVFLTDLSAVNFDLPRVKADLEYTINHADKNYIIPHAYYWKDSTFLTEYATPDNWNHFWFVITCASYLRHSGDKDLINRLYPYLSKSIEEGLKNNKNGIIWAYRPDWWDIGHNFGPRAFMTILASKALQDYVYISSQLGKPEKLMENETLSYNLTQQLNQRLWDDSLKYLVNYFEDGTEDKHYYIGSLPAADFRLLSEDRIVQMVQTAQKYLLDKKLGIYTVYPMDFHKLIDYLKFAGNEAGNPFYYINGGIWSHGNTFFALALKAAGKVKEAAEFVKRIMTIDGVMNTPNGEPAMYEYRNGNINDPAVYGKVDKPQFMWAAGFYIYSLYHIFGINENSWNISFTPFLMNPQRSCSFTLNDNGKALSVDIKGKGSYIKNILYDGNIYPSAVIPESISSLNKVEITLGKPDMPYLSRIESKLESASYSASDKKLTCMLSAFTGHNGSAEIISLNKPKKISVNGENLEQTCWSSEIINYIYKTKINYTHKSAREELSIDF